MPKNVYTVAIVKGKRKSTTNIKMDDLGFTLGTFGTKESHNWADLASIELDGPDNLNSRITATRLLTLGVFALAAKKKTGESYAYITLGDGSPIVLEFPKTSFLQLKSIFAPYLSKVPNQQAENQSTSNTQSASEQIKELANLLEQGLITQDDYDSAKKQILGI